MSERYKIATDDQGREVYHQDDQVTIINADVIDGLRQLPDESIQTVVTSPPYWLLRDYGVQGQIGLESTWGGYVAKMVDVFREVRRVLKDDGTLWINLGDSCAAKNLIGIPWRVALALQADGWCLRSEIIWHKPNPMPESVTDRPTKAHEYIFLLSKSERYFYDQEAIKEPSVGDWHGGDFQSERNLSLHPTTSRKPRKSVARGGFNGKTNELKGREAFRAITATRNKRTVWTVATQAFSEAHFATFPEDLIKPCILAGARSGDTVLDPFGGSGTTAKVAKYLGRKAVLIELNPDYCRLAVDRVAQGVLAI